MLLSALSESRPHCDTGGGSRRAGRQRIDDLFTPEINSDALGFAAGNDWTTDNQATMQHDDYKVKAILNEIGGYDHSGAQQVGTRRCSA